MSVVAVTSSRTSPGATALATGLAMVWSHRFDRALFVEADTAGGVQSLRFGLDASPSLTTFGSDVRNGFSPEALWSNTQDLRGARVLTAPVDPRLSAAWIERITPAVRDHLPTIGAPVVLDLGQVGDDSASLALAAAADTTLIVTAPEIAEIQALLFQVSRLRNAGANIALVTIGSKPNDPAEIAHLAGVPLAAVLPNDRVVASALVGGKVAPQKVRRSLLWRTIGALADSLVDATLMEERRSDESFVAIDMLAEDAQSVLAEPELADTLVGAGGSVPPPPVDAVPLSMAPPPVAAPALASPAMASPAMATGSEPSYGDPFIVDARVAANASQPITPAAGTPTDARVTASPADYTNDSVAATPPSTPPPATAPGPGTSPSTGLVPTARLIAADGTVHPLAPDASTVLGRHRTCDILVADAEASRRHGCVVFGDFGWRYRDLESSNGSRCNGHRISDVVLRTGDELRIGRSVLRFELVPLAPTTEPSIQTF